MGTRRARQVVAAPAPLPPGTPVVWARPPWGGEVHCTVARDDGAGTVVLDVGGTTLLAFRADLHPVSVTPGARRGEGTQ